MLRIILKNIIHINLKLQKAGKYERKVHFSETLSNRDDKQPAACSKVNIVLMGGEPYSALHVKWNAEHLKGAIVRPIMIPCGSGAKRMLNACAQRGLSKKGGILVARNGRAGHRTNPFIIQQHDPRMCAKGPR